MIGAKHQEERMCRRISCPGFQNKLLISKYRRKPKIYLLITFQFQVTIPGMRYFVKNYCKFVEKDSNVIDAPKRQLINEERV